MTADCQGPADDRAQVDEDALAEQVVNLVLAHVVPGGESQKVRPLVSRVAVDVHSRMLIIE